MEPGKRKILLEKVKKFWVEGVVEELSTRYHIPQNIGRVWLEGDELLLLLDGLDEVPFDRQDDCVQAINRFRADRGLTHPV